MNNYLIFGGVDTRDYGIEISGEGTYKSPVRDMETVSIPGRDGDLTIDKGRYTNVPISYPAFIREGFEEKMAGFRSALLDVVGYAELTDSYHPDEKRIARLSDAIDPSMRAYNKGGSFILAFDCKPHRYLLSDEEGVEYTESGTIVNEYNESLPLIRIYGFGSVSIAGEYIRPINHGQEYTDIDCETMNCFYGSQNLNQYVEMDSFPTLKRGENRIVLGAVQKVVIFPRWRRL